MSGLNVKRIDVEGDEFNFVPFGDLHLGNVNCDYERIDKVVGIIKKRQYFWLGMGDYGDAIIPNDPRFTLEVLDRKYQTPQDQYKRFEEIANEISGKCLGLLEGNHERVHAKHHSHNYLKDVCEDLKVDYLSMDAVVRINFKDYSRSVYDVYAHHGWTGARTKGGRINRIHDLDKIFPFFDLYLMGHVHDLGPADSVANLFVDDELEIREKISRFVNTGSYLKTYVKGIVSYAEEKTYPPALLGSPLIKIKPRFGKATMSWNVEVGTLW